MIASRWPVTNRTRTYANLSPSAGITDPGYNASPSCYQKFSTYDRQLSTRVMKTRLLTLSLIFLAGVAGAEDLPRKAKTARESYPGVDVIYDSVTALDGKRLRAIITKPQGAKGKLPTVFVAGWLSCDSVEAPEGTTDAAGLAFRGMAQLPGFCLFRIDKQGVGDSEGTCSETDFDSELAGYRAAFHALKNYDFVDTSRIYVLGISNGGGFAPLVAESETQQAQIRGYVSVGGWMKTWFEHMLEIERRRFGLMGKSPGEVTDRMRAASALYSEWLLKGRGVPAILKEKPELAALWPDGKDQTHLYGRPLKFYQDLQKLNLAAAWSRVKVPSLILHGQFDWIMSREDPELMAEFVNANAPNAARFVEVPEMGHTFQHYRCNADAFADKAAPFDPKMTALVTDWLQQQEAKPAR